MANSAIRVKGAAQIGDLEVCFWQDLDCQISAEVKERWRTRSSSDPCDKQKISYGTDQGSIIILEVYISSRKSLYVITNLSLK